MEKYTFRYMIVNFSVSQNDINFYSFLHNSVPNSMFRSWFEANNYKDKPEKTLFSVSFAFYLIPRAFIGGTCHGKESSCE